MAPVRYLDKQEPCILHPARNIYSKRIRNLGEDMFDIACILLGNQGMISPSWMVMGRASSCINSDTQAGIGAFSRKVCRNIFNLTHSLTWNPSCGRCFQNVDQPHQRCSMRTSLLRRKWLWSAFSMLKGLALQGTPMGRSLEYLWLTALVNHEAPGPRSQQMSNSHVQNQDRTLKVPLELYPLES